MKRMSSVTLRGTRVPDGSVSVPVLARVGRIASTVSMSTVSGS